MNKLPIISPGEILFEEFMKPNGLSQNKLARDLDIPPARINDIVNARRGITADTALRFSVYFGTTPEFWLNLQTSYDLKMIARTSQERLRRIIRPLYGRSSSKAGFLSNKNPAHKSAIGKTRLKSTG
jgi:addiction module HigA family antidote